MSTSLHTSLTAPPFAGADATKQGFRTKEFTTDADPAEMAATQQSNLRKKENWLRVADFADTLLRQLEKTKSGALRRPDAIKSYMTFIELGSSLESALKEPKSEQQTQTQAPKEQVAEKEPPQKTLDKERELAPLPFTLLPQPTRTAVANQPQPQIVLPPISSICPPPPAPTVQQQAPPQPQGLYTRQVFATQPQAQPQPQPQHQSQFHGHGYQYVTVHHAAQVSPYSAGFMPTPGVPLYLHDPHSHSHSHSHGHAATGFPVPMQMPMQMSMPVQMSVQTPLPLSLSMPMQVPMSMQMQMPLPVQMPMSMPMQMQMPATGAAKPSPVVFNMAPPSVAANTVHDMDIQYLKKRRRIRRMNEQGLCCEQCSTTETPEWRKGPNGAKTLCNACGLQYAKKMRREKSDKDDARPDATATTTAAAAAASTPPECH